MKHSEAVDRYLNHLKLLNSDEHISRRFVLKLLKDVSTTLISQKSQERTINREQNLFSRIDCIEFEKADVIKCPIVEFRRCDTLMKSKNPLPKPLFSRLGASIIEIESLDSSFEFRLVDKRQYRLNKKRRYKVNNIIYIYLSEDYYLYIPDEEIFSLNLSMITLDTEDIKKASSCQDSCVNNWDAPFIIPDKLTSTIFDKVTQELTSVYKNIQPDINPNDLERA